MTCWAVASFHAKARKQTRQEQATSRIRFRRVTGAIVPATGMFKRLPVEAPHGDQATGCAELAVVARDVIASAAAPCSRGSGATEAPFLSEWPTRNPAWSPAVARRRGPTGTSGSHGGPRLRTARLQADERVLLREVHHAQVPLPVVPLLEEQRPLRARHHVHDVRDPLQVRHGALAPADVVELSVAGLVFADVEEPVGPPCDALEISPSVLPRFGNVRTSRPSRSS